jgi:hypothetical protein
MRRALGAQSLVVVSRRPLVAFFDARLLDRWACTRRADSAPRTAWLRRHRASSRAGSGVLRG